MDLKKIRAFAGGGPKQPGGKQPPKPKPGEEEGEGGGDKISQLLPIVEENAGDIEAAAESMTTTPDEVFGAEEPEQAWSDEAASTMDDLDPDLQDALKPLSGCSVDDAHELAGHLADEGLVDDAEVVAAWLYLVGCHMAGMGEESEDGEDEGEEDDEDEDLEDEGGGY